MKGRDRRRPETEEPWAHPSRELLLSVTSMVAGAVLGWAFSALAVHPDSVQLWASIFAVIQSFVVGGTVLFFVTTSYERAREGIDAYRKEAQRTTERLEEVLSQRARLIPRARAYSAMAACVDSAEHEVALISLLMFDPDRKQRTFRPVSEHADSRARMFESLYRAIRNPRISYLRVFQVPPEYSDQLDNILAADDLYAQEVALITSISKTNPKSARLVVTDQYMTTSIVLVDQKHLFINIDVFDPAARDYRSPFVLFIEDATEQAFIDLQDLIIGMTTRMYDGS